MQTESLSVTPRERFLCCALADDPEWQRAELGAIWLRLGDEAAWEFAVANDSESIVASALARVVAPSELPDRWRAAAGKMTARLRHYLAELDRVAAALAAEGIRIIALKNSGVARALYPDLSGCPMGDVDTLVSPRDFRRAHACMLQLGYTLASRSPWGEERLEKAERGGGAEYTFMLCDGSMLWFELQWRPVAGRWIRPDQEPPVDELLARSIAIPGSAARLLAPEDNLLQVCLHTAKHSYVRAPGFRLHTDVDRIVRRCPIDWERFARDAERLQVRTAVYFSLGLPAELLRTPVPLSVLERLRPPAWKERWARKTLQRAGLFNPHERKWNKAGYIVFNLMLHDSLDGVRRAMFPSPTWMQQHYAVRWRWTLPWWYAIRILELLLKRAKT